MAVGIVVVSHSAKLAEAAGELAREMAGPDLRLALAGGVDDPDVPLGTDAMRVLAAIEELDGADGVLVLMDLGSAVLSAELALDLLPDERRARVVLCDAPLVEGLVAAAVQAAAGAPMDRVVREARSGLVGKADHLGAEMAEPSTEPALEPVGPDAVCERRLTVPNRLGLHARPAGRVVAALAGYQAEVTLQDATTGRGPVRADSLNAIITLGVRGGHELVVRGRGPDAEAAVAAVLELAATGFGDAPDAADAPAVPDGSGPAASGAPEALDDREVRRDDPGAPDDEAFVLHGRAAAPGLAIGTVHRLVSPAAVELPDRDIDDVADEQRRLRGALDAAARGLRTTQGAMAGGVDPAAGEILEAQRLLLEDPLLVEAAMETIATESLDAARAWQRSVASVSASYRELDDPYLAERGADVDAIGVEVLRHLLGSGSSAPVPSGVVVGHDLSPAETARLDPDRVDAVVTGGGSPTGHAALIARSLGIPSVVGLGARLSELPDGATVVVDGTRGIVESAPDAGRLEEVRQRIRTLESRQEDDRRAARGPARTRDGVTIEVLANVGSVADAGRARESGADGVGLLRSELLFLDRREAPDEHEQADVYDAICSALQGRPVVVRTLDVGGDKPLPYVPGDDERNPFLGVRGLRLALAHPEMLLIPQLRAVLRVAARHPLRLMVPMVTTLAELDRLRVLLEHARSSLSDEGVAVPERLALGTMVEVPALALRAEALMSEVDFVSIGTNDLTQYVLATERGNAGVDHLADPLDPAVLRLIAMVCTAASEAGVPVTVCGGLASDPVAVGLLLGLGVRELSVPAPDVPMIKRQVRATDLTQATGLARSALAARSAADVRALTTPAIAPGDTRTSFG